MKNEVSVCRLDEPKGSFWAIPLGALIIIIVIGIMDYFFIDIISGFGNLVWLRDIFGVLSGNEIPLDHIAWIFLVIIIALFIVGVVAVLWWKAIVCAVAIPLLFGAIYALLGMSFGEPILLQEIFINPIRFILPYLIPSVIASIAVSSILSQKKGIWTEKMISRLK